MEKLAYDFICISFIHLGKETVSKRFEQIDKHASIILSLSRTGHQKYASKNDQTREGYYKHSLYPFGKLNM